MTTSPPSIRKLIRQTIADAAKEALESKNCKNSLANFPRVINPNMLPLVVVSPQAALYDMTSYGVEQFLEIRLVDLLVHVAQGTLGTNGQAEDACEEFIDLLQDYFGARDILNVVVDADIEDIFPIDVMPYGDAYIQQFTYADPQAPTKMGVPFLGTTFTLQVSYEKTIAHVI